jgi:phosphoribosylglycinamide formyltransferase 1
MDTGPILAQAEVDLRGAGSLAEVERRGLAVEHRFYSAVLADLFASSI